MNGTLSKVLEQERIKCYKPHSVVFFSNDCSQITSSWSDSVNNNVEWFKDRQICEFLIVQLKQKVKYWK